MAPYAVGFYIRQPGLKTSNPAGFALRDFFLGNDLKHKPPIRLLRWFPVGTSRSPSTFPLHIESLDWQRDGKFIVLGSIELPARAS
ncbi:MAG: hypothetical protein PVH63_00740 [Balneolaceae bacterium]